MEDQHPLLQVVRTLSRPQLENQLDAALRETLPQQTLVEVPSRLAQLRCWCSTLNSWHKKVRWKPAAGLTGAGNTGRPPAKPQATGNKPPRAFPFALPAGSAAPLQGVFATILGFATARGRGAKATKTSTGALPRNPPTALATSLPLGGSRTFEK